MCRVHPTLSAVWFSPSPKRVGVEPTHTRNLNGSRNFCTFNEA